MPYSFGLTSTCKASTTIDNLANWGGQSLTMRAEFYVRTPTAFAPFMDITQAPAGLTGTKMRIGNVSGKTFNILCDIARSGSFGTHYSPDGGCNVGRWIVWHTTIDYSGGAASSPTVSHYMDGVSVGTGGTGTAAGSGTALALNGVGSRIYVGGRAASTGPSHLLRNTRIWNRLLSPAEIATDAVTELPDETARIFSATLDANLSATLRDGSAPDGTADTLTIAATDVVRCDWDDLGVYNSKLCLYFDARSGFTDAITYSAGAIRWVVRQVSAWTDRALCGTYANATGSTSFQPWKQTYPQNAVVLDGRDRAAASATDIEVLKYLTAGTFSFTGAAWTSGTKTLTKTGAFTNLSSTITTGVNDKIVIAYSNGSSPTYGVYTIASKTNNDTIVLSTSFSGDATDVDGYGGVQIAPYCNSRNMTYYFVAAARNVRAATARTLFTSTAGGIKITQEANGQLGVNGVTSTAKGGILPAGLTVYAAVCTASAISVYQDGVLVDTLAAASNVNEYVMGLNATLTGGNGFEGALCAMLVYQAQHTAAQVSGVTNILAARHSITTTKTGVLFVDGSSSPAGFYCYYNETPAWRLSQMAAFKYYRVYDFGEGGGTLSTMTTKAANTADKVLAGVADAIGIMDNVGSNDINGTSTDTQVLTALSTYASGRKAVCPSMKFIVTSMQPRSGVSNDATKAGYTNALNAALASQSYIDAAVRRDLMWQFLSDGSGAATQPYSGGQQTDTTHRNNAGFDAEFGPLVNGILTAAGSHQSLALALGVQTSGLRNRSY